MVSEGKNDLKPLQRLKPGCRVLETLATWERLPVTPGVETHVSDPLLFSREIVLPAIALKPWDINSNFCIWGNFKIFPNFYLRTTKHKWSTRARMSAIRAPILLSITPSASAQASPALSPGRLTLMTKGKVYGFAATVSSCLILHSFLAHSLGSALSFIGSLAHVSHTHLGRPDQALGPGV